MTFADRLRERVSKPWLRGRDRRTSATTAGVFLALWMSVLPSKENRIPERSPEDFPEDFDSDHND